MSSSGQHEAGIAVGIGAAVTIVGAALPWLHSGQRTRSSFELVAVARRLGLSPDGWQGAVLHLWPLIPLLCVLATVAAWWGRRTAAACLAVVSAVAAGWLAWAVRRADLIGNLRIAVGPMITLVGAVLLVVAATLVLVRAPRAA